MERIVVHPDRLPVFGTAAETFVLITDEDLADLIHLHGHVGHGANHVAIPSVRELPVALRSKVPAQANVLAITRTGNHQLSTVLAGDGAVAPGQRVCVLPTQRSALPALRWALTSLERSDPLRQHQLARRLFEALRAGTALKLTDSRTGSVATVELDLNSIRWRGDAGHISPGSAHVGPPGSFSIHPAGARPRLPISGQVTLSGFPVVSSQLVEAEVKVTEKYYERLSGLAAGSVVVSVEEGTVIRDTIRVVDGQVRTSVEALNELFTTDEGYEALGELGFGLNTTMSRFAGNSSWNLAYGGRWGSVRLGLGHDTPVSVALVSTTVEVVDEDGNVVLGRGSVGDRSTPARRLNRVSSAACVCHETSTTGARR